MDLQEKMNLKIRLNRIWTGIDPTGNPTPWMITGITYLDSKKYYNFGIILDGNYRENTRKSIQLVEKYSRTNANTATNGLYC